jgi:hypothetical protein
VAWFIVWAVLIIGWLVGVFFGLRWLWRKAVAFGREVEGLAEVADRLSTALENHPAAAPVPEPSVGTDPADVDLRARVKATRRARAQRRTVRDARHRQTYREWAVLAGLRD